VRVKICGLTRMEDAALAQRLGAWALGFILYPQSKRYVRPEAAREIVLESRARCVGVFVNQTDEAIEIARHVPFAGLQLHGDETPDDCRRVRDNFGGFITKALRPETEADLEAIDGYKDCVDYLLIDTPAQGEYGGTGKACDWGLAASAAGRGVPLILAGGLGPGNIAEAEARVPFFAADLSSGIESAPGVKDAAKMEILFDIVKGIA
jgi:phosphoribosylanthranilate isomerase